MLLKKSKKIDKTLLYTNLEASFSEETEKIKKGILDLIPNYIDIEGFFKERDIEAHFYYGNSKVVLEFRYCNICSGYGFRDCHESCLYWNSYLEQQEICSILDSSKEDLLTHLLDNRISVKLLAEYRLKQLEDVI